MSHVRRNRLMSALYPECLFRFYVRSGSPFDHLIYAVYPSLGGGSWVGVPGQPQIAVGMEVSGSCDEASAGFGLDPKKASVSFATTCAMSHYEVVFS